jgi:large conductance mechanosensitive channel
MGMGQEFKKFAMRGNVVDMAVGVVIGAAFGKIVSTLVAAIVTPLLGLITGGVNFGRLHVVLREAVGDRPTLTLEYGAFLQSIFDFVIIAFSIFMVVKLMNRLKAKEQAAPAAPPEPPAQEKLLGEIRDLLKARA